MTNLSLRRLWKLYKAVSMRHHSHTRRELVLLQEAFYSGARGVLKVLDYMIEHGDADEAQRTIRRFGRQVNVIMRKSARRKAH